MSCLGGGGSHRQGDFGLFGFALWFVCLFVRICRLFFVLFVCLYVKDFCMFGRLECHAQAETPASGISCYSIFDYLQLFYVVRSTCVLCCFNNGFIYFYVVLLRQRRQPLALQYAATVFNISVGKRPCIHRTLHYP